MHQRPPTFDALALTAIILVCAGTGCRQHVYHEVYAEQNAREIRALEDRIYEYDSEFRALEQELWAIESENEQLRRRLDQSGSSNKNSSRKNSGTPEEIDSGWELPSVLSPTPDPKANAPRGSGKPDESSSKKDPISPSPSKDVPSDPPREAPGSIEPPPPINLSPSTPTPDKTSPSTTPPIEPIPNPSNTPPSIGMPSNPIPSNPFPNAPSMMPQGTQESNLPTPSFLPPDPNRSNPSNASPSPTAPVENLPWPKTNAPGDRDRSDINSSRISVPEIDQAVRQASALQPTAGGIANSQSPIDRSIADIAFHPSLCRGINLDDAPEDDGIYIVLQPKNRRGEFLPEAGEITIIAHDLSRPKESQRIARWTLNRDEFSKLLHSSGSSQGFHVPLRWQNELPRGEEVEVFVRCILPDGRTVVNGRKIALHRRDSLQSVWTPRAESRTK